MKEIKTVAKQANDSFIEKRSEFIGHIKPVHSREEALTFINEIKALHKDATHNCWAYIIDEQNLSSVSDDGEPQGTAGQPILQVLQREGVTNVCVVVTRYFGGTLLGAGGLIRAYAKGAKISLDAGGVTIFVPCNICEIFCDYNQYGKVSDFLNRSGTVVRSIEYQEKIKIVFELTEEKMPHYSEMLKEMSAGEIEIKVIGEEWTIKR